MSSILAALFLRMTFGNIGSLGATVPGSGVSTGTALTMEILLTTGLVNTILGTASGALNIGTNGALAVGGCTSRWPASGPLRSVVPRMNPA